MPASSALLAPLPAAAAAAPALEPVRFHRPAPHLAPYVSAYYLAQTPGPFADRLHPEWANLRFVLAGDWAVETASGRHDPSPGAAVFGPTSRSVGIACRSAGAVVGVGILPMGFERLFEVDAADLADRATPLSAYWPEAGRLHAALRTAPDDAAIVAHLDRALGERIARRPPQAPALQRAHALLLDPAILTVEAFAAAMGVSPRHLNRICRRMFGFPPKLLLRRQRFLRTLESARRQPDRPWAELLDLGYCDQSHFVHDFQHFMGVSPSRYFRGERPMLAAAARARSAALGSAYQGLHAARA